MPGLLDNLLMESEASDDGDDRAEMVEMDFEITFADQLQMFENKFPKPTSKEKSNKPKKVKKKKSKLTEKDEKENKEKSNSQIQGKLIGSSLLFIYVSGI